MISKFFAVPAQNERASEDEFEAQVLYDFASNVLMAALAASATETRPSKLLFSVSSNSCRRRGKASLARSFSSE